MSLSRGPLPSPLRSGAQLGILDITKYFGDTTGGIRTYLLQKASYVAARPQLRQTIVIPGAEDSTTDEEGVRWYRLRGRRIPADPSYRFLLSANKVRRILEHEKPHLIEVGSPLLVPWITQRANRAARLPMVWFYHSHLPRIVAPDAGASGPAARLGARLAEAYVRALAQRFRRVLVASDTVAEELEALGVRRVARISMGVELERFNPVRRARAAETRRRNGLPSGALVLFVGRLAGEKRLEIAIDAWAEVERHSGATLVIVGQGPSTGRWRARAAGRRIIWLPYQRDRDRLADLIAAADLYLAPCPSETFGLAALEAMASGTPVLSVDRGAVAERVLRSGAGALYPAGDVGGCAEAALRLLSGSLESLGRLGRAFAERHHAWDRVFDRIFEVYREVLAGDA
jgi:alpha-1,6-mannosyltransferase